MLCAIAPGSTMFEETLNTLKYANRAKEIKVQVEENKKVVELHVAEYKNIIDDLRKELDDLNRISRSKPAQQPQLSGIDCPACTISSEAEEMIEEFKATLDEQIQLRKKVCEIKAQNMQNQFEINKVRKSAPKEPELKDAYLEIENLEKSVDLNQTIKKDTETQIKELSEHANNLLSKITRKLKSEDSKLAIEKIFQIKATEVENLELELNLKFYEKLNRLLAEEYKQLERQLLMRNIDFGSSLNVRQLQEPAAEQAERLSRRTGHRGEDSEETQQVVRRISARNRFQNPDEIIEDHDDLEVSDQEDEDEIEIDDSGLFISKTNEQIDEMKQLLRQSGIHFEEHRPEAEELEDGDESRYLGVEDQDQSAVSQDYPSDGEQPDGRDEDSPHRDLLAFERASASKGISIDPRIEIKKDPRASVRQHEPQPSVPHPGGLQDEADEEPPFEHVSKADMLHEMQLLNTVDKARLNFDRQTLDARGDRFSTVRGDSRKERVRWNATINWGEEFRLYQGDFYPESCGCLDAELLVNEKDFEELLDPAQLRTLHYIELGENSDEF